MPAAARVGDVTNHGGSITGPGMVTVMIGGMPAAVAGDMHACPIPPNTGHIPSSPFPVGSTTVLVGGKPVIRAGDTCICGASAAAGFPTVMIG